MRVLNDREERTETSEVGFLSLLTHALMVSLGMASILFAPVPMILAHLRLLEPWSKVSIVVGSLVAMTVLEVPVSFILVTFAVGLFVSDSVSRKPTAVWRLLGIASALALASVFLVVLAESSFERVSLAAYWNSTIDGFLTQTKALIQVGAPVEWDLIRGLLLYEGPFLVISAAIFSVWVSIGFCAHTRWLTSKSAYAASTLRNLKPSLYVSMSFLVSLLGARVIGTDLKHVFSGAARILAAILFVQGTVVLSKFMNFKGIRTAFRTVSYCLFILIGFYALIALGFISPLLFRRKALNKVPIGAVLNQTEEAI